jgi:hypothetical protein
VWNTLAPEAPWCPDECREPLDALAPGLSAAGSAASRHEATGHHLSAEKWSLLVASRRGRLHAHRGEHREDAGSVLSFADGWCTAVADGAGSAEYSRLGSAMATRTVTLEVREALLSAVHAASAAGAADVDLLGTAMRQAAQRVNDRMRDFAAAVGIAGRELRTTLLVATRFREQLAVMQVGDGAMALVHRDGSASHPHAVATGDYSGEVTHFLPDDGALEVLQASVHIVPAADVVAVLLASDGVEDPWYPFSRYASPLVQVLTHGHDAAAPASLPPALVPVFTGAVVDTADPVQSLCEWLAFEKRGENDDRTLCLAYTAALERGRTAS